MMAAARESASSGTDQGFLGIVGAIVSAGLWLLNREVQVLAESYGSAYRLPLLSPGDAAALMAFAAVAVVIALMLGSFLEAFFVIAIIAAIFGFGGIAASAAGIAKIVFVVALILAVVSFFIRRP